MLVHGRLSHRGGHSLRWGRSEFAGKLGEQMIRRPVRFSLLIAFTLVWASVPQLLTAEANKMTPANPYLVYVGTYTATGSKGIYNYRFDPKTGKLTPISVAAQIANPSFLATDPQHRLLYALTEMGQEPGADSYRKNGSISRFRRDRKTCDLTFLNKDGAGGGCP